MKRIKTGLAAYHPAAMLDLQLSAFRLGLGMAELGAGAAMVIAKRTMMMGHAMLQPHKLADPEFALMVTEKMAAVGEAAERASRHALRRRPPASNPAEHLADTITAAQSVMTPFRRRVRANVKRLK
ncbi:MAG: hypothetical protein U1E17_05310 [Geminicoccaceae bacterium]